MTAADAPMPDPLPLFPLQTVLFPGGVLPLKVFEARYLDLISHCLRTREPFGVACIIRGNEAGAAADGMRIEAVGVLAHLQEVDAEQAGILKVSCIGGSRFRLLQAPVQRPDGLWVGTARVMPADDVVTPDAAFSQTVQALKEAADALVSQDVRAIAEPYRWDDAGWVANRWSELLPVSLVAKQRLMELEDPVARLRLVDEFLRSRRVHPS
jgi:Lon protease-like protein